MRQDALLRLEKLFGQQALNRFSAAKVLVAGLGGVGGFALEALARCGIGSFVLVDADRFEDSNMNRQILCTEDTVASFKTDTAEKRILSINPSARIEKHPVFLDGSNFDSILTLDTDVVVDAIDSVESKCWMIQRCIETGIPVVSSMGAALRMDPTKIAVGDISETHTDPLARAVRRELGKRGISKGVKCVFSKEAPARRDGALGSFVSVTGVFGLTLAQIAIDEILSR